MAIDGRNTPALSALVPFLSPVLRAVAAGAGPGGRTCLIDAGSGPERAAHALAIVRSLAEAPGPHRLLARVLREVLFETDRDLGDGTARVALLWGGLVRAGARALAAGVDAEPLAAELDRQGACLSAALAVADQESATSPAAIAAVAESAGATPDVAAAISAMLTRVGADGAAEIVEGRGHEIQLQSGDGFLFDATPASPAFAVADLDPAFVLVVDERVENLGPLVPLLEGFATRGKALVIVARDVSGPALRALVRNHKDNGLRAIALRPAAVGQAAADVLEDLALATGATLVADRHGTTLARLRPAMLGRCGHFAFASGLAVLRDPAGDGSALARRRALLLAEAEQQKFLPLDRERLQLRAARLHGAWARLALGGDDAPRRVETARRALASAHSALRGGTVAGGGVALVQVFDSLPKDRSVETNPAAAAATQVMAAGVATLVHGLARGDLMRQVPVGIPAGGLGRTLRFDRHAEPALLDPLPLTRSVLQRALSGAITLLRSGAVIGA